MLIPDDQSRLRELAQEVTVAEGELLFREGQDLSVLYLVIRGFSEYVCVVEGSI